MAPTPHLLGVFVTSEKRRAADLIEQAYELSQPPFSVARRIQLRTPEVYGMETFEKLKSMARERQLIIKPDATKHQVIHRLQDSDYLDRQTYERWLGTAAHYIKNKNFPELLLQHHYCYLWRRDQIEVEKLLAARFKDTLASTYKADPSRKSFTDLPAEVRNIIYGFSMFGEGPMDDWNISWATERRISVERTSGTESFLFKRRFCIALRTSTLGVLSAIDMHIRREVRSYFWANLGFKLTSECSIEHFLQVIGPDRRTNITKLQKGPARKPSEENHDLETATSFQKGLRLLPSCVRLQTIDLEFNVSNLFYNEVNPLQDFFVGGNRLKSPVLDGLADTLASLPNLKHVAFTIKSNVERGIDGCRCCGRWYHEPDNFLRFAFTGKRQDLLYKEIKKQLQVKRTQVTNHQDEGFETSKVKVAGDVVDGDTKPDASLDIRTDYPDWRQETYIRHAGVLDLHAWLQTTSGREQSNTRYTVSDEDDEDDDNNRDEVGLGK